MTSNAELTRSLARLRRAGRSDRRPGPVRRVFAAVATTRIVLFVTRTISWKIDPVLLRVTGGRVATTKVFPVAVLETTGARSGARRRNAVIYWNDEDRVIIAASHAGHPRHPQWYFNVRVNPHVSLGGVPMRASLVPEAERDRLWRLGDRACPAFASYRQRAASAGRTIPLIELTPLV